jgi:glucose-1-phosphate thymidylyltransferase
MTKANNKARQRNVVGIVPMAGMAKRLDSLDCSKEIYPVEYTRDGSTEKQAKVVCEHVLMQMQRAGIDRIYITLRDGKWDIPACLGDGSRLGLHLAYLMMGLPHGTPYSIDQAYPFIQDNIVALGFADTLFAEEDVFSGLLAYLETVDADVVLGLFPTDRPEKTDMVDLAADGAVNEIVVKPRHTDLTYCWGIAVWTPAFTQFMHNYLDEHQHVATSQPELFVGNVIQAGSEAGLRVYGIPVSEQPFLDIGTPEDLRRLESYIRNSS